jgi:hypothetical protein
MADEIAKTNVNQIVEKYSLPKDWKINQYGATALMTASMMSQNQYARYASIPIVCKGKDCPFMATCGMDAAGIDVTQLIGQRCPMEIQFIIDKFDKYKEELDIDQEAEIDLSLVKELVDLDVMIRRADLKMAQEGDFVEQVAVSINMKGQIIKRSELSKSVDLKDKMLKKRHDILQLLNSTRKDKAGSKLTISMDPSSYAAMLLEKKKAEEAGRSVDADYEVKDSEAADE